MLVKLIVFDKLESSYCLKKKKNKQKNIQLSSVKIGLQVFIYRPFNHHSRQQSQQKEHRVEVPLFPHTTASLKRLILRETPMFAVPSPRQIIIYSPQLPFNTFLVFLLLTYDQLIIAGHRHQGRCRWHRHSGIPQLSPVPEHSGTELGFLITVPGLFRHKLYECGKRNTLHVFTAGGVHVKLVVVHRDTLHIHTSCCTKRYLYP